MISRSTARILGEAFAHVFTQHYSHSVSVDVVKLYDFLFDHNYQAWFCNLAKSIKNDWIGTRPLKEFIMRLHTGETAASATSGWSWQQRERLGHEYLENLATDMVSYLSQNCGSPVPTVPTLLTGFNYYGEPEKRKNAEVLGQLTRALELDGYGIQQGKLLRPEEDALDARESAGVLESMFAELGLQNQETSLHHLKLSEDHYLAQLWDDCISNARKFLELTLSEVAAQHSQQCLGVKLSDSAYKSPRGVRDYLADKGLLEGKEKDALAKVYGLLSETGAHPYMARNDQARLLRHLALTFAQFVMLRLRGALAGKA